MSASRDPDTIVAAWLDDGPEDLPSSTRRAITTAVRTTPQSRTGPLGLRAWRPPMSMPKAALAAVAVLVLAVSGVMLLGRSAEQPGAVGAPTSPSPTPTATAAPTATPAPSEIAPGITGFTPYTSPVYGLTFGVPEGWTQGSRATLKWREGIDPDAPYAEAFESDDESNDEKVAVVVWQQPAGPGADITTRDGLAAWVRANDPERDPDGAIQLCVGKTACGPAILLPASGDTIPAYIADPDAGLVTIVLLGRTDDFPGTARYGGGIQLLTSILTTMDVYEPEPGQIPAGS